MRVAHAPGMPVTLSPPPRVSDPDMHQCTCVMHVPWCMPGSLTCSFLWGRWRGKRSRPSRPGTCATRKFRYLVRDLFKGGSNDGQWKSSCIANFRILKFAFGINVYLFCVASQVVRRVKIHTRWRNDTETLSVSVVILKGIHRLIRLTKGQQCTAWTSWRTNQSSCQWFVTSCRSCNDVFKSVIQ